MGKGDPRSGASMSYGSQSQSNNRGGNPRGGGGGGGGTGSNPRGGAMSYGGGSSSGGKGGQMSHGSSRSSATVGKRTATKDVDPRLHQSNAQEEAKKPTPPPSPKTGKERDVDEEEEQAKQEAKQEITEPDEEKEPPPAVSNANPDLVQAPSTHSNTGWSGQQHGEIAEFDDQGNAMMSRNKDGHNNYFFQSGETNENYENNLRNEFLRAGIPESDLPPTLSGISHSTYNINGSHQFKTNNGKTKGGSTPDGGTMTDQQGEQAGRNMLFLEDMFGRAFENGYLWDSSEQRFVEDPNWDGQSGDSKVRVLYIDGQAVVQQSGDDPACQQSGCHSTVKLFVDANGNIYAGPSYEPNKKEEDEFNQCTSVGACMGKAIKDSFTEKQSGTTALALKIWDPTWVVEATVLEVIAWTGALLTWDTSTHDQISDALGDAGFETFSYVYTHGTSVAESALDAVVGEVVGRGGAVAGKFFKKKIGDKLVTVIPTSGLTTAARNALKSRFPNISFKGDYVIFGSRTSSTGKGSFMKLPTETKFTFEPPKTIGEIQTRDIEVLKSRELKKLDDDIYELDEEIANAVGSTKQRLIRQREQKIARRDGIADGSILPKGATASDMSSSSFSSRESLRQRIHQQAETAHTYTPAVVAKGDYKIVASNADAAKAYTESKGKGFIVGKMTEKGKKDFLKNIVSKPGARAVADLDLDDDTLYMFDWYDVDGDGQMDLIYYPISTGTEIRWTSSGGVEFVDSTTDSTHFDPRYTEATNISLGSVNSGILEIPSVSARFDAANEEAKKDYTATDWRGDKFQEKGEGIADPDDVKEIVSDIEFAQEEFDNAGPLTDHELNVWYSELVQSVGETRATMIIDVYVYQQEFSGNVQFGGEGYSESGGSFSPDAVQQEIVGRHEEFIRQTQLTERYQGIDSINEAVYGEDPEDVREALQDIEYLAQKNASFDDIIDYILSNIGDPNYDGLAWYLTTIARDYIVDWDNYRVQEIRDDMYFDEVQMENQIPESILNKPCPGEMYPDGTCRVRPQQQAIFNNVHTTHLFHNF